MLSLPTRNRQNPGWKRFRRQESGVCIKRRLRNQRERPKYRRLWERYGDRYGEYLLYETNWKNGENTETGSGFVCEDAGNRSGTGGADYGVLSGNGRTAHYDAPGKGVCAYFGTYSDYHPAGRINRGQFHDCAEGMPDLSGIFLWMDGSGIWYGGTSGGGPVLYFRRDERAAESCRPLLERKDDERTGIQLYGAGDPPGNGT